MSERDAKFYHALLEAGVEEEDILQKFESLNLEYHGLMAKSVIYHKIAKEYGINIESEENKKVLNYIVEEEIDYNDFSIQISGICEGMQNIVITGRISEIFGERFFERKDGSAGKVASFQIEDDSDSIKIVLWGNQTEYIKNEFFEVGQIIHVVGGYSKVGYLDPFEVHLNKKGKVVLAPEGTKLPQAEVRTPSKECEEAPRPQSKLSIQDLFEKEGFIKSVSGLIKIDEFKELDKKDGGKTFLLKLTLSDNTTSISVNVWGLNAVEVLKVIEDEMQVQLSNVVIKENSYSNAKELSFIKSSTLEVIKPSG